MQFYCYSCEITSDLLIENACPSCGSGAVEETSTAITTSAAVVNSSTQAQPQSRQETQPSHHQLRNEASNSQSARRSIPGRMMFHEMNPMTVTFIQPNQMTSIEVGGPFGVPLMNPFGLMSFISITTQMMGAMFEPERKNVTAEKFETLEKVSQIKDECAICQVSGGQGIKLNCNHDFHVDCIKPWFENANTCPCCRQTV